MVLPPAEEPLAEPPEEEQPARAAAYLYRYCTGTGGIGEIIRLLLHPRLAGADWNEYQECHRAGGPD